MTAHRYLFALVDGGGNVPPELSAVRRLVERGHMVTVIAEDSVAREVRATGARLRPWVQAPNRPDRRPVNDVARDWECRYPWQLIERLVATLFVGPAPAYAHDVREAIADTRPQLVICSMFCLGGMVAAEAAGLPFDVQLPNIYPLPAKGLPPFGVGLHPARGAVGRLRDRVLNAVIERLWDTKGLAGLNALRVRHALTPLAHFLDQARRARRQLVLTSAEFDFAAVLPPSVRYVGPVLDDPIWATNMPWAPPAGSDPLILVAMSSTFQDQIDCLQRVVDALSTLPVRGLVTTGPAIDALTLRPRPNVTVVPGAPHRHVLQHAALVVTHAGHGTVMKALAADVPMVLLPHGRDQADTAARVISRGAGIVLKRTAKPGVIADAVRRVLQNDSYRLCAQRLGDAVRGDANSDALVRELEDLPDDDEPRGDVRRIGGELGDSFRRKREDSQGKTVNQREPHSCSLNSVDSSTRSGVSGPPKDSYVDIRRDEEPTSETGVSHANSTLIDLPLVLADGRLGAAATSMDPRHDPVAGDESGRNKVLSPARQERRAG
jgi:MGT family glycosyltransferase